MFLELKVLQTEGEPRRAVATSGQTLQVGRLKQNNQLSVPDPVMAPVHFSISCDGTDAHLQDLNHGVQKHAVCSSQCFVDGLRNAKCSATCRLHDRSSEIGVYVNGKKVSAAPLRDGDVVVAGSTGFTVSIAEAPPEPAPLALELPALTPEQQQGALAYLAQQKPPLFAVLDAARAPEVLETLRMHSEVYYSLYDGMEGEKLDNVAPYLVQLHFRSPLAEALIREHWGKSWGVLLWALADFKAVRRHLRRFLIVQDAKGKDMYFRFYDPRVLRVFLPTCTPEETKDFFGPIGAFMIESDKQATAWLCSREPGYPLRLEELAF